MNNLSKIPPLLQAKRFDPNEAYEDLNSCLNLDQNRIIIDPEENETDLSQKIIRMSKEHFLEYFQPKNYSEELQTENTSLREKNGELKKQIQVLTEVSNSVQQNKRETPEIPSVMNQNEQDVIKIEVKDIDIE